MTAAFSPKSTVLQLAGALAAGRTTSRELVEQALARIADPHGEGARTFVKVYGDNARAAADAQDGLRKAGYVASPLAGLPVSIKDLFDIAGEQTLAGSKALDDAPPAKDDALAIARLRGAGAVLIGRTNMTEFAFSGVGINPHYGTPGNPYDRALRAARHQAPRFRSATARRSSRSAPIPADRCVFRRRSVGSRVSNRRNTGCSATA